MAVLDWITPEPPLALTGESVRLRPPRMADYRAWSELRRVSRDFLQPWEPTWPQDDLSRASFRRRLSIYTRDLELAQGYAFFVFRQSDDALVWVGQPHARQGYTLDAVRTVCGFAFRQLGLHRLEAACLPENQASHRLLAKAGFEQEGLARAYLKINGRWSDHLLFGKLNPT
jgi:ribosomal-protein-alanine N-acetyltransferase